MKDFGGRLKHCRQRAGFTQEEAGKLAGITAQSLSNYEKGKGYPSLDVFCALTRIYKVSADWLLGNISEISASCNEISNSELEVLEKLLERHRRN